MRPSGEKTAERTQLTCPESEHKKRCCGTDHILQFLSSDAETSDVPSGEKHTERTGPECALMTRDLPCDGDDGCAKETTNPSE